MNYDVELWAMLPELEQKNLEEEEVSTMVEVDLSDEEAFAIRDLLVACGGETSEEVVEEKLPNVHQKLRALAELEAEKAMALRLVKNKCFEVDTDDFFEEDLRSGVFKYVKPDDLEGDLDDEEGYVDALFAWKEWELNRLEEMEAAECVDYLLKRYKLKLNAEDLDYGYFLPDELTAEAMAQMMN